MRSDDEPEAGSLEYADAHGSWDCFAGPASLLQDDRYPAAMTPFMMAARTMAFTAALNATMIESLVRPPRGR